MASMAVDQGMEFRRTSQDRPRCPQWKAGSDIDVSCQTSLHHFQTVLRQRPFRIGSCFFICRWDWWCKIGLASRASAAHTSAPTYRVRHQIWGLVKTYITLNTKCCEILNTVCGWTNYTPYFGFQRPGFGSYPPRSGTEMCQWGKAEAGALSCDPGGCPASQSIMPWCQVCPRVVLWWIWVWILVVLDGLGVPKGGHRLGFRGGYIFWLNKRHTVITSNDTYWISRGIDKTNKWTH